MYKRQVLKGLVEVELRDTAYTLLAHTMVSVQIQPLSVQQLDVIDFAGEMQEHAQDTIFAAYRLCVEGADSAYASVLFCRPKQMRLPQPFYTCLLYTSDVYKRQMV